MTDSPPPPPGLDGYWLGFLTDEWQWEAPLAAGAPDEAKAEARAALLRLVEEEAPKLACVTLLKDGVRIGVWDWVERQPYWTAL